MHELIYIHYCETESYGLLRGTWRIQEIKHHTGETVTLLCVGVDAPIDWVVVEFLREAVLNRVTAPMPFVIDLEETPG